MFKQDCTCPVLLEDTIAFYPYRIITYYDAGFQQLPVLTTVTLGWSDFARHYFRSLG